MRYILIFILVFNLEAFVGSSISKIDDLYKIYSKEVKLSSTISKTKFIDNFLLNPMANNIFSKLSKNDKLNILLSIASKKKLIKPTQQLYYKNKFQQIENGDKLLLSGVKNNKNLDEILKKESISYKTLEATKLLGVRTQMKILGLVNDFKTYPIKNLNGVIIGNFRATDFYNTSKTIQMPSIIFTTGTKTSTGYLRNSHLYWKKYSELYPKDLSPNNLSLIKQNKAPIVDDIWIKAYPKQKYFKGDVLEHHHLHHNAEAVPLPKTLHRMNDNKSVFHSM